MVGILIPIIAVLDDHRAAGIVEDPDVPIAAGDRCQLDAFIVVIIGSGAIGPAGTQAIGIISVRPGGGSVGHGCQLPTVLPGEGPGCG